MAARLADGAEPILKARLKGLRPADMVIVSQVGAAHVDNPLVRAKPLEQYDWRWVRGLDVCVHIDPAADWFVQLKDIALQRPAHLCLWNPVEKWGATVYLLPTAQDIAKPVHMWRYELDFSPWQDFQNDDFMTGRTYGRNEYGVPYAVNP